MTTPEHIHAFLIRNGWVHSTPRITFLAAGEYNENWKIETDNGTFVFRINHGSQLGLADKQITYEYAVLDALKQSGVTPKPLYVAENTPEFGGVMLMSFLPGVPLDYTKDTETAAQIFAAVHAQPVPASGLIVQADPVADIAAESIGLLNRYTEHLPDVRKTLLDYYATILKLADDTRPLFAHEPLCIVNTEVNSGNFLITENSAALVDWEKAVISCRYQDLGHFLVPTTTLWKTDFVFSPEARRAFLEHYRRQIPSAPTLDELDQKTAVLEKAILLRALSWCYMAYHEYTAPERKLKHDNTFTKIQHYLDNTACFFA